MDFFVHLRMWTGASTHGLCWTLYVARLSRSPLTRRSVSTYPAENAPKGVWDSQTCTTFRPTGRVLTWKCT